METQSAEAEKLSEDQAGAPEASGEGPRTPAGTKRTRLLLLGLVLAVLAIAGVVWFTASTAAPTGAMTSEGTTSISKAAGAIIASAAQSDPAGFVIQGSGQTAQGGSDWATLQHADGSEANVTVIIYPSTDASQSYYQKFVAGVSGLPGYTDVTSDLSSFQQYGRCYGYGEDVDGIAVVNGVCTKGNAFLQVHLVSGISFSDLEGDLTALMGALYQGAA